MPDDEYIVLERYRGYLNQELTNISGSFPVLITDYINCQRLKKIEEEKKILNYFLSEQLDLEVLKTLQFIVPITPTETTDQLVSLDGNYNLSYF